MRPWVCALVSLFCLLLTASAEQCGSQAGGAQCPGGLCCSNYGWCGSTSPYCDPGNCQSQCPNGPGPNPPSPSVGDISSLIPRALFERMLLHRNNNACPGKGFYTYDGFIAATKLYPTFASVGNTTIRKREIAAFLAQTSHETTGGWPTAPDGPYAWGYCFLEEATQASYCVPSAQWPCAPRKSYHGRGPIQISYNYNYGPAGRALGLNLLNNPELVSTNPTVSFKTALWFWMTTQRPKPSCHDVITNNWTPSPQDVSAKRLPGYGVITNIINGGLECGRGTDARVQDRIGFYKRYCDLLGVSYGNNLDCGNQRPFGSGFTSDYC